MKKKYRVKLTLPCVCELLSEFRKERGLPAVFPLSEKDRDDFEFFAICEGQKRNIDVFGDSEYRDGIYSQIKCSSEYWSL